MRNHLVRRQTSRAQEPFLLNHALCDDPPLLVRFLPDKPLYHLIPFPAHLSADVEGVSVGALLPDESVEQNLVPDLWRQHLLIVFVVSHNLRLSAYVI